MLPEVSPHKAGPEYSMDLGQNDSAFTTSKGANLTIARSSRRKSIEDNFLMHKIKFVSPESRTKLNKGVEKGGYTDRMNNNDTFNSRLQTEEDTNALNNESNSQLHTMNPNKSMPVNLLNSKVNKSQNQVGYGIPGMNNRLANRSYDNVLRSNRYSPSPDNTYK